MAFRATAIVVRTDYAVKAGAAGFRLGVQVVLPAGMAATMKASTGVVIITRRSKQITVCAGSIPARTQGRVFQLKARNYIAVTCCVAAGFGVVACGMSGAKSNRQVGGSQCDQSKGRLIRNGPAKGTDTVLGVRPLLAGGMTVGRASPAIVGRGEGDMLQAKVYYMLRKGSLKRIMISGTREDGAGTPMEFQAPNRKWTERLKLSDAQFGGMRIRRDRRYPWMYLPSGVRVSTPGCYILRASAAGLESWRVAMLIEDITKPPPS